MNPQCVVEVAHQWRRHPAYLATDALHRDRTDLFGLSFGIAVETGVASLK